MNCGLLIRFGNVTQSVQNNNKHNTGHKMWLTAITLTVNLILEKTAMRDDQHPRTCVVNLN